MNAATIIAVHLMNDRHIDYKAIALALFSENPNMFLRLSGIGTTHPLWMFEVATHMKDNNKVEAIKAYRTATGSGLYESKQVIDYAMEYFDNGMRPLSAEQMSCALELRKLLK